LADLRRPILSGRDEHSYWRRPSVWRDPVLRHCLAQAIPLCDGRQAVYHDSQRVHLPRRGQRRVRGPVDASQRVSVGHGHSVLAVALLCLQHQRPQDWSGQNYSL
ncbi:hypothetical protein GGF44_001654, partial [Coemansia sp. RSA 1694]